VIAYARHIDVVSASFLNHTIYQWAVRGPVSSDLASLDYG
jgi:hypothetical protein